jgi:hypothetical protein
MEKPTLPFSNSGTRITTVQPHSSRYLYYSVFSPGMRTVAILAADNVVHTYFLMDIGVHGVWMPENNG